MIFDWETSSLMAVYLVVVEPLRSSARRVLNSGMTLPPGLHVSQIPAFGIEVGNG